MVISRFEVCSLFGMSFDAMIRDFFSVIFGDTVGYLFGVIFGGRIGK